MLRRHDLSDHSSQRKAQQVDLLETAGPDEGGCMDAHLSDAVRGHTGGVTNSRIVEDDDRAAFSQTVDHGGVP